MDKKIFSLELNTVTKLIFDRPGVCDVRIEDIWEEDELAQLEVEDDYRNLHKVSVAKINGEWVLWIPSIESPLPLDEIDSYLFNLAASQLGTLRRENA